MLICNTSHVPLAVTLNIQHEDGSEILCGAVHSRGPLGKFILAFPPTSFFVFADLKTLRTAGESTKAEDVSEGEPSLTYPRCVREECTHRCVVMALFPFERWLNVGDVQSGTGGVFVDWLMIHRALTPSSSQPTEWRDT